MRKWDVEMVEGDDQIKSGAHNLLKTANMQWTGDYKSKLKK